MANFEYQYMNGCPKVKKLCMQSKTTRILSLIVSKTSYGSETLYMASEGLGVMFQCDFAEKCAKTFLLTSTMSSVRRHEEQVPRLV